MEYLLKVATVVTIFYIIYIIFLKRDTFFESNRWFLMIGLIASLWLPFLVIPMYSDYSPVALLDTLSQQIPHESHKKPWSLLNYLTLIYAFGVAYFSIRFMIQFMALTKLLTKNKGIKEDQFTYIKTGHITSPFSFFKWIVYNPETFSKRELEHIIEHEKIHGRQYHSVDIIMSQLFCILLWFNPLMWYYHKNLRQNLEFIADKHTLKQYNCIKSYQYTMLKTSLPSHQMALSNHFYNSLIKKRILMLHKSKSRKINQLKYALVFPALLGFLISCNSNDSLEPTDQLISTIEKERQPLIILDGETVSQEIFENLDPNDIYSMTVWKDEEFTKKYGDKGKYGVLEITTKLHR